MNVRENSPVLAPHHCVSEHPQIRLQQSGLVVGREQSDTKRYIVVLHEGSGVLPDHFVAAAGVNNVLHWIMRVIVPWPRIPSLGVVHLPRIVRVWCKKQARRQPLRDRQRANRLGGVSQPKSLHRQGRRRDFGGGGERLCEAVFVSHIGIEVV